MLAARFFEDEYTTLGTASAEIVSGIESIVVLSAGVTSSFVVAAAVAAAVASFVVAAAAETPDATFFDIFKIEDYTQRVSAGL